MPSRFVLSLLAMLAVPAIAFAQVYTPDFDPSRLKGPKAGTANELLVLGSPHLSGMPESFNPAELAPLIDKLAAWKPQLIAIEALSGPQCDFIRRYPDRYRDTIESYCWDPAPARATTGLDVPAATAEAEKTLASWPANPSAAERRRLAALFLAGGERGSALVQWLRLPPAERRAGDGLDDTLVALLDKLRERRDESMLVAAPLAARLGLERLHAMDDHTADSAVADEKAYGEAIMAAWKNPASAKRKATGAALVAKLGQPGALLAMYRAYNAPEEARLAFEGDFGAALEEPSSQGFGRSYLGYWETRNLRMAANIRNAIGTRPTGVRTLVVVGASHKGYLEAYLDQMHDVRIVDAEAVLR